MILMLITLIRVSPSVFIFICFCWKSYHKQQTESGMKGLVPIRLNLIHMYLYIPFEITYDGIKSVTSRMDEKGFLKAKLCGN